MVDDLDKTKPSYEAWTRAGQMTAECLTLALQYYSRPSALGGPLPLNERQFKVGQMAGLVRQIQGIVGDNALLLDGERLVEDLVAVLGDVLNRLPAISHDMQQILESPWRAPFLSGAALLLFQGPPKCPEQGLGSGKPVDGHLPQVLQTILERERTGESRVPSDAAQRQGEDEEVSRRWVHQNASFLRSAGRVE